MKIDIEFLHFKKSETSCTLKTYYNHRCPDVNNNSFNNKIHPMYYSNNSTGCNFIIKRNILNVRRLWLYRIDSVGVIWTPCQIFSHIRNRVNDFQNISFVLYLEKVSMHERLRLLLNPKQRNILNKIEHI